MSLFHKAVMDIGCPEAAVAKVLRATVVALGYDHDHQVEVSSVAERIRLYLEAKKTGVFPSSKDLENIPTSEEDDPPILQ